MPRIRYLQPAPVQPARHRPEAQRRSMLRSHIPQPHLGAGWWAPRTTQLARHAVHADGLPASADWPAPPGWRGPPQPRAAASAGLLRQMAQQTRYRQAVTRGPPAGQPLRAVLRKLGFEGWLLRA